MEKESLVLVSQKASSFRLINRDNLSKTGFCTTSSLLHSSTVQHKSKEIDSPLAGTPLVQTGTRYNGEATIGVPALVNERVKYTTDLARLSTSNPLLAFTLTVVMFSIAGIPPLAGFYSKAFLMFAAISSANYVLAIIGITMSVISAFYYLRIVKIMYFESLAAPGKRSALHSTGSMLSFMQINKEISLVCAGTLSFLLFFSLHPKPIFLLSQKAALLIS